MSNAKIKSTRTLLYSNKQSQKKKVILTPYNITPSHQSLYCLGVLNPTIISIKGQRYLIFRADEYAINQDEYRDGEQRVLPVPILNNDFKTVSVSKIRIPSWYDYRREPILPVGVRQFISQNNISAVLMPYLPHIRIAEIDENDNISNDKIFIFPDSSFSAFGCEDPRSSIVDNEYFISYNAIGYYGSIPFVLKYNDIIECSFIRGSKAQMVFGPDHKHACYFPIRIKGRFMMLMRPLTRTFISTLGVWLYSSPDLQHWRAEQPLIMPRPGYWDSLRVGPGVSPIQMPDGFLTLYYGVDDDESYHIGACLLDKDEPNKIIKRSMAPILSPSEEWECNGRRADTVFSCGATLFPDGEIRIYYGAADTVISVATLSIDEIIGAFE